MNGTEKNMGYNNPAFVDDENKPPDTRQSLELNAKNGVQNTNGISSQQTQQTVNIKKNCK